MRWFRLWSGTKRAPAKKAAAARAADLASLNRDIREAGVTSLRAIARELNAREEIDANDPKRPLPPSAREPVFDFDIDWPACITQVAPSRRAHQKRGVRSGGETGAAQDQVDRFEDTLRSMRPEIRERLTVYYHLLDDHLVRDEMWFSDARALVAHHFKIAENGDHSWGQRF